MKIGGFMKESGLMIRDMAWDLKSIRTLTNILVILRGDKLMVKASMLGIIVENCMRVDG